MFQQWFRPLRLWLKCFGVDLRMPEEESFSVLSWTITSCWIAINFGSNILDALITKTENQVLKETALETFLYNRYVDDWSWCLHATGIQVGLLVFAKQHWPATLKLIQTIELKLDFPEKSYRKLRKIVLGGIFHVVITVGFLLG